MRRTDCMLKQYPAYFEKYFSFHLIKVFSNFFVCDFFFLWLLGWLVVFSLIQIHEDFSRYLSCHFLFNLVLIRDYVFLLKFLWVLSSDRKYKSVLLNVKCQLKRVCILLQLVRMFCERQLYDGGWSCWSLGIFLSYWKTNVETSIYNCGFNYLIF